MPLERPSGSMWVMRTQNPVHEVDFKWTLENVSHLPRRLHSLKLESQCAPVFQLVAKFVDKFPDVRVAEVHLGLARIDAHPEAARVEVSFRVTSIHGDVYAERVCDSKLSPSDAPFYFYSGLFGDLLCGLKPPNSGSPRTNTDLVLLRSKGLVACHQGGAARVFLVPGDILVLQGKVRTSGCCLVDRCEQVPRDNEPHSHVTPAEEMLDDLRAAYEGGAMTDVELRAGPQRVRAHRFVLAARCPVFRRMFEHDTREKSEGVVDITDVDAAVLEALVWYLYTGRVRDLGWEATRGLYEAADKYEVAVLRDACENVLALGLNPDTACDTLELAELHQDAGLKGAAMDYIRDNFSKVRATVGWESFVTSHDSLANEVLHKLTDSLPPPKPRREVLFHYP